NDGYEPAHGDSYEPVHDDADGYEPAHNDTDALPDRAMDIYDQTFGDGRNVSTSSAGSTDDG
ncbi:hypothetical protein IW148_006420, partial [Coemansia sp. RSA 1199]